MEVDYLGIGIGIGAIGGAVISYFLLKKSGKSENLFQINDEENSMLKIQNERLKKDLLESESSLEQAQINLIKYRNDRDKLEDHSEDTQDELSKLKNTNSQLAQEIEKLKYELNEYEILYNARKQEVADLKKQLDQNG